VISLKGFLGSVEKKVYAATGATTAVGVAVAVLNDVEGNHALLGALPETAQTVILVIVPGVLAFLSAYKAPHTARPAASVPPADASSQTGKGE
jgi:hypothetical protein